LRILSSAPLVSRFDDRQVLGGQAIAWAFLDDLPPCSQRLLSRLESALIGESLGDF